MTLTSSNLIRFSGLANRPPGDRGARCGAARPPGDARGRQVARMGCAELSALDAGHHPDPAGHAAHPDGQASATHRLRDGPRRRHLHMQGIIVGAEGFSSTGTIPGLLGFVIDNVWMAALVVVAWQKPRRARSMTGVPAVAS